MQEINEEEKNEPIEPEIQKNSHLSILKKIFHTSSKEPNSFLPILISTDDIPKLFYYLKKTKYSDKEKVEKDNALENLNFQKKLEILNILMNLFKSNKNLICLFMNKWKSNTTYFFEPIIDLYLEEEISDSDKIFLEEMILFIITNVSIPKFLLEYIYQKIAIYLRYIPDNIIVNKLNQEIFLRYLNLLEIFYTNSLDKDINKLYNNENENENIINNYFDGEQKKEIKNYLYFNGYNSKMTILLNRSSYNVNCDFPTLELGCSFVFWINLDKDIINEYYIVNNDKKSNKIISLISFLLGGHQIRLQLIDVDNLLLIVDDIESNPINISEVFKYENWNNICVLIYPKKSVLIKIIVNGITINYTINIPKNYNLNTVEKIDNITLFENLIGKISSILFCGNVLNNDIINAFGKSQGFYKIKYLYKFLLSIDNNYYENSHNYKYFEKFKSITTNKNFSKINIFAKEQNIKNIVGLFCPFAYDDKKNQLDDIFGNFIGIISSEDDGVNNYINYSKNIQQIGEINNLLPLIELMLLSRNPKKLSSSLNMNKEMDLENLLTEEVFIKIMHLIKKIITGKKYNLFEANHSKFFSHLGLFIEKFPSEIFNNNILNIFYEIGKETFQYIEDKNYFSSTFVNMILLNEKIFSKFSEENQLKLWDDINKFFTSDYSQLKDSLNMSKICLIIRFYDKDRYNKYCCKKHANLFKLSDNDNISNIMNPDMNTKVGKLFETIQLFVNKLSDEHDTVNLFKLLSLDLSPCLQKKIIITYQYFFENHKISNEYKLEALKILIKNDFFDIFEYVLSVSLLDVRIELLELFRIISINFKAKIEKYIEDNKLVIIDYLGEYLLPSNLKVKIDNNNKIAPLIEYFNQEIYNNDITLLWNVLNNWITYKSVVPLSEKKDKEFSNKIFINQSVINIFIQFVSKVSPYYIDCLLILLFSLITNITIYNRNVFLKEINFYKWLIEVIYFFYNKQNEKIINENEKQYIDTIKIHSIELFKNYLQFKKGDEENDSLINYLLDYSYYLKKKNNNDLEQIKEITNITRILLLEIIDSSSWDINIISKSCFEFLFLYKNNEILNLTEEIKKEIEEEENFENFKKNNVKKSLSFSVNVINTETEKKKNELNIEEDIYESIEEVDEDKIEKTKTSHFDEIAKSINQMDVIDGFDIIGEELNSSFDYEKRPSKNKSIGSMLNAILIPDILYENLNMKESKNNINKEDTESNININKTNNILKDIWEDSKIYDYIIDYYSSNVWGIENLCKIVKIDYDKKVNDIFRDLLREYGENKQYKNILMKTINNYSNLQNNNSKVKKNEKSKINIFNLNLILLCIAFDTTGDIDEKNFIENNLEQFLIFCILYSVNIAPSEKEHKNIQLNLYNLLGYGLFFLQRRDEAKYSKFVEQIILPIFEGIQNENTKKGIKGIFTSTKKGIYKHTAIYKLFYPQDSDSGQNKRSSDKNLFRTLRTGTIQNKLSFKSKKSKENEKEPIFESLSGKNLVKVESKRDKKKDKDKNKNKKNEKIKIIFDADIPKIIKYIIDDTIKMFKIERNKKDNKSNIIEFNKYNLNNKNDENKIMKEENRKINEKILNLIPFLENQIRKYSNTSLIQEKRRRNEYKKMKKKLFSWRGFWSQRELFFEYPEHLKLKVKNHFTKEMAKVLLSPILDIDYYMPSFSKFDTNKLFNKEDLKYKVNLNIDYLLSSNDIEKGNNDIINNEDNLINIKEEEKKENINNDVNSTIIKNKYGFNYLECIYKLTFDGLWEQYKTYYEQKIILDSTTNTKNQNPINNSIQDLKITLTETNTDNDNLNLENKKSNKNIKITKTKPFKCCLVKNINHLQGYILCENKKIKFKYSQEKEKNKKLTLAEIMDDPSYDKDMNNCFGSTFRKNLKDYDKVYLIIPYEDIQYIFLRKYFYQNTAMEIYTTKHKSYFFNFKANTDLCNFMNQILYYISNCREIKAEDHKGKRTLGHEQIFEEISDKKIKSYYVSNKMEEWQNYKISTMEYLMWLNIYSGRSFNDLTQYPVFPWIISNYKDDELEEEKDFRNLSIPIGMMEYNEKSILRKETFIDQYETVKNDLKESNHDFNYQEYLKKGEEYFYNYRNKKLKLSERNYSMQIGNSVDNEFAPNSLNNSNNLNINDNVSMVELNQLPSYYGSHYSNPTYVSHYLTRIFPYSFVSIEIQGEKFDDPNRIFHSMKKTFESCMTLKDDVRELIPEFYFLPEMFKNNNNLNLTQDLLDSDGEKIVINDVELPPWANNSPFTFVAEMRNNLEKSKNKINKWIDLIFGTYQKGEKAEEIHNIFQAQTYERMVKIDKIKDIDMRDAMMRLVEVGVTPSQIFDKDSKGKNELKELFKHGVFSYAKGIFLDESNKLNKYYITSNNYKLIYTRLYENKTLTHNKDYNEIIYPAIIAIKCLNPKNLKIFTNNNLWYNIKISNHDNKLHIEESHIYEIENNSSKFAPCYPITLNNIPFIIYNKERYIIRSGFWDCHLEISILKEDGDKKEKEKEKEEELYTTQFTPSSGPVVTMKMTKDEKLLFCGTKYGNIVIFNVKGVTLEKNKILYDHCDSITSISINENLNMFATSSLDGYINIYTLPSFNLVRSIRISSKVKCDINDYDYNELKTNEFLYADNLFLSSCPLPCLTFYILSKRVFKSYTINGEFISKVKEEIDTGSLKCPIIFQNLNFQDFLIYGTDDGYVKIRSFPGMKLVNSIKPFEGQEIKALELSPDKRFCYIWSHKDKIAVIKDLNTSSGFEIKDINIDEFVEIKNQINDS